ncbi:MAG: hypothetical protein WCH39_16005 [Schlesneria sp.]
MSFDFNQFKRDLIYTDQASVADIRTSINEIREFDRKTESLLTFLITVMTVAGLCTLFSLFAFFPLAVIPGSVLAICAVFYFQKKKQDLLNRRYELTMDVVNALSRDMPKEGQIKLKMDLTAPDCTDKKTASEKVYGWDVTYFEDPWLRLEGRFTDGTAYDISMNDRFQSRTKWARSSSGKSKKKSKTKLATVTSVKLFPKQKKYVSLAKVTAQTNQLLKLPTWVRIKKVSAEPDLLAVTTVTSEKWSVRRSDPTTTFDGPEIIYTSLLSLYQVLHESKLRTPNGND